MPSIDRGTAYPVLSSDWTGLSPHLIAAFYPVKRVVEGTAVRWEREPNSTEVRAPVTEAQAESTANWISPFENQTADAKLGSLSAMFQSGGFEAILNALQQYTGKDGFLGGKISDANNQLARLEGKTAVTKLNSTQIFSGMPPMKLNVTAHFRALFDADAECVQPMNQLFSWGLPKHLATQGIVGNALDQGTEKGWRTVYPSDAPQIIAMKYADCLFLPMVIESSPYPLNGPRDKKGHLISGVITLSMGSLTAIDKDDWAGFRQF